MSKMWTLRINKIKMTTISTNFHNILGAWGKAMQKDKTNKNIKFWNRETNL